jgi:hypothetical protein
MVTKRTGRPRTGRPKKDGVVPFLQNPKRLYVAWLRMNMELMPPPPSIRAASKIIAAKMFGNRVGFESLTPEGREIVENCPPGMITEASGPVGDKADGTYKNTKRGAKAATVENAAEYIRKLDRQAAREAETNPDVARWLRYAVRGFVFAYQGAPAALVEGIFRNSRDPELGADAALIIRLTSGDPELGASAPGLARFPD